MLPFTEAKPEVRMLRSLGVFSVVVVGMALNIDAQDRSYGRSVVMTDRGIVATSHYLASQAGAQVLVRGRSAMGAAIPADAPLGVTEPLVNRIARGVV